VLIDSILDERNKAIEPNQLFLTKVKNKASVGPKRIEINSATIEELVQLPQIGPVLANNIIAYRNTHGAFYDIEDLIKVKGIGKKKLNAIKPYIFIQQN
jgi:competence protein ComEA